MTLNDEQLQTANAALKVIVEHLRANCTAAFEAEEHNLFNALMAAQCSAELALDMVGTKMEARNLEALDQIPRLEGL